MTTEIWALLTLLLYVLIGAGIVLGDFLRCPEGWRFWAMYLLSRLWTNTLFGQRITHRCSLPITGGALLVANHRSPIDPMLILSASGFKQDGFRVRVIEFMTAREYVELPGAIGWLCRVMQSIPVERDGKDTGPAKEALRRLRNGRIVGIFPEGKLNTGPSLLPFNDGVAWLALRSRVPVYPVFIHDAPQKGTMVTPFYTLSDTRISWGQAIDLSQFPATKPTPDILREVAELLRERMASLGGLTLEADNDDAAECDATIPRPRAFAG